MAWFDLACCFDYVGQEQDAQPCYRKTFELGEQALPEAERPGFFVGFGSTLRNNLKLAGPQPITTERLILRPLTDEDAPAIFEYGRDPEVSKYTTWSAHQSLDDSRALIAYAKKNYQRNLCEPYGITLKSEPGKVIGTIGWFWVSEVHKNIELAYALARPHWGKGLIVEASKAILSAALHQHNIHRISSRCIAENAASARVMEKLGMKYEGTQREVMYVKDRFVDLKLYSVLRSEWSFT